MEYAAKESGRHQTADDFVFFVAKVNAHEETARLYLSTATERRSSEESTTSSFLFSPGAYDAAQADAHATPPGSVCATPAPQGTERSGSRPPPLFDTMCDVLGAANQLGADCVPRELALSALVAHCVFQYDGTLSVAQLRDYVTQHHPALCGTDDLTSLIETHMVIAQNLRRGVRFVNVGHDDTKHDGPVITGTVDATRAAGRSRKSSASSAYSKPRAPVKDATRQNKGSWKTKWSNAYTPSAAALPVAIKPAPAVPIEACCFTS